ncbi:hypothetical protein [Geopseudomonas aromaticivorans]
MLNNRGKALLGSMLMAICASSFAATAEPPSVPLTQDQAQDLGSFFGVMQMCVERGQGDAAQMRRISSGSEKVMSARSLMQFYGAAQKTRQDNVIYFQDKRRWEPFTLGEEVCMANDEVADMIEAQIVAAMRQLGYQ